MRRNEVKSSTTTSLTSRISPGQIFQIPERDLKSARSVHLFPAPKCNALSWKQRDRLTSSQFGSLKTWRCMAFLNYTNSSTDDTWKLWQGWSGRWLRTTQSEKDQINGSHEELANIADAFCIFPTKRFPISEPQNPLIDVTMRHTNFDDQRVLRL